jgi:hypothetical protein
MTQDLTVTADGKAALTEQELDAMQDMLDAHDRGGFYMTYKAMTGSEEAYRQTNVATFSEGAGGVKMGANRLLQTWTAEAVSAIEKNRRCADLPFP